MSAADVNVLRYAVRGRVVIKYVGHLCLVLLCLVAVPCVVAAASGELLVALRYVGVIAVLGVAGAALSRLPAPSPVQPNEGIVIAASMFVLAPLLMSYPMMGSGLTFGDALFEAVSGVTTTGLTTLATVEDKSGVFLFGRAWMQWYGGLGIVVLLVALVIRPGRSAMRIAGFEIEEPDLVGGTRAQARPLLVVYGVMTVAGILVLWAALGDLPPAVLLTLASVSTGGFAPHDDSLAALGSWPARVVVLTLCLAGAVPMLLYRRAWHGAWRKAAGDVQLLGLLVITAVTVAALTAMLRLTEGLSWIGSLTVAAQQGVSAQTTAGFSSVDLAPMHAGSKLVMILAMFVGGGLGSTAGGVKIVRMLILLQLVRIAILRTGFARHAVVAARLGGRPLEEADIQGALLIVLLYAGVVLVSWAAFLVGGHDPMNALFEVVSATGTVGLSTGISGPELAPSLKAVLCVDMLMGRLEVFALLVVLYPPTWIGSRIGSS